MSSFIRRWLPTIASVFLTLAIIIGCMLLGTGYRVTQLAGPTPTPEAALEDLLIDEAVLPEPFVAGAAERGGSSGTFFDDDNLENIVQQFAAFHGGYKLLVTHRIWRYRSPGRAEAKYNRILNQERDWGTYTESAERSSSTSSVAQEMVVFCGDFSAIDFCRAVLHYDQYVVQLSSHIDHETMTYEDFDQVVGEIDRKMTPIVDQEQ